MAPTGAIVPNIYMAPLFGAVPFISGNAAMQTRSERPLLALIEAGGVNDIPVIIAPAAPTSDALVEALKIVKEAGYRVSKPRKSKIFKRGKDRVGPTFVAEFADGEITRMSTFTSLENLDWNRGECLAQAAWEARWRARERKQQRPWTLFVAPVPPAIVSARFEQDGVVLARRPDSEQSNVGGEI
jgi:hypothetical protein